MAKQKQEEAPKGSPAWMATFSDLMNLLLCFFVLLFSMSTVAEEKFLEVMASIQHSFSILPQGGTTIAEGQMISSGISHLQIFDDYFDKTTDGEDIDDINESNPGQADQQASNNKYDVTIEDAMDVVEQEEISESERIAEEVEGKLAELGIGDLVEVDFNATFVQLTLNGALLFDSGHDELREEALIIVDKIAQILEAYDANIIEIEGHTDNVPITSGRFPNNDVLSMYRALYVADYVRSITSINPANIKSAGRGQYVPIADNTTAEGRARNRRVEIKIYNSFNSNSAK